MISIDISNISLRTKNEQGKTYVHDPVRKKWLVLTKEEYVRQVFLHYLIQSGYPISMLAVEKAISVGDRKKRFDIVVFDKQHLPWMLVECKEPDTDIHQNTLFQLLNYQRILQTCYWVLTNGHQTFCANATDLNKVYWMDGLPAYEF